MKIRINKTKTIQFDSNSHVGKTIFRQENLATDFQNCTMAWQNFNYPTINYSGPFSNYSVTYTINSSNGSNTYTAQKFNYPNGTISIAQQMFNSLSQVESNWNGFNQRPPKTSVPDSNSVKTTSTIWKRVIPIETNNTIKLEKEEIKPDQHSEVFFDSLYESMDLTDSDSGVSSEAKPGEEEVIEVENKKERKSFIKKLLKIQPRK